MKRLLTTITNSPNGFGGVSTWIERMTQALADYDWQVTTLTQALDENHLADWKRNHPRMAIRPIFGRFVRLNEIAPTLERYLDREKPNLVAINFSFWMIPTLQKRKREGHPLRVIAFCHTDNDAAYAGLRFYRDCLDHVICFGSGTYQRLLSLGFSVDRVSFLPHGVQCPQEVPTRSSQGQLRIVYVGRLSQMDKRVLDLVPLIQALNNRGIDYRLDLFGSGPDEAELRAGVRAIALEGRVEFHGWMPASEVAARVWPEADICLNLSNYEAGGAPLSVIEGMAYGTVPVVSQVTGIDLVVREGETGRTFPIGDVDTCADQVASLDRHRDQLAAMSRAASSLVREQRSIESHARRLVDILNGSLEAAPQIAPADYMGLTSQPLARLIPGWAIVRARRLRRLGDPINEGYTTFP